MQDRVITVQKSRAAARMLEDAYCWGTGKPAGQPQQSSSGRVVVACWLRLIRIDCAEMRRKAEGRAGFRPCHGQVDAEVAPPDGACIWCGVQTRCAIRKACGAYHIVVDADGCRCHVWVNSLTWWDQNPLACATHAHSVDECGSPRAPPSLPQRPQITHSRQSRTQRPVKRSGCGRAASSLAPRYSWPGGSILIPQLSNSPRPGPPRLEDPGQCNAQHSA